MEGRGKKVEKRYEYCLGDSVSSKKIFDSFEEHNVIDKLSGAWRNHPK